MNQNNYVALWQKEQVSASFNLIFFSHSLQGIIQYISL